MSIYRSGIIRMGTRHLPLFISLFIMAIFLSPFIVKGDAVVLPWLDNMDSFLVWNKLAAEYIGLFESSTTIIPPFMNGLPMYGVAGGFSTFFVLNKILPAFSATAVYYFLLHTTAVVGMYWLTKNFIAPQKKWLAAAAALAFGLQAFLPAWGLGIAGIPMMIALYLRNKTHGFEWSMYLLILFYAISSNVQSAGVFIIGAGFIAASVASIKEKKINWNLYAPPIFLTLVFAILRGELFYNLLSGAGYESHRTLFNHEVPENNQHILLVMWQALKNPLGVLLSSGVFPFVMLVAIYPLFAIRTIEKNEKCFILMLYTLLILLALYAGNIQTTYFVTWRNGNTFFKMYSLERLLILVDIAWYLLFAYSLKYIAKLNWSLVIIPCLMLVQIALHFYHATWWKAIIGSPEKYEPMAYKEYYSENLFAEIKRDIALEQSQYRTAAFGIHPAVLLHNGFYTADGYCSNYPLAYKKAFRKIIAAELPEIVANQKSATTNFDTWGHKLYLQSSSLFEIAHTAPPITKEKSFMAPTPYWDVDAMRQLKIKYVFAAVEINSPQKISLQLRKQYANKTYQIYLYEVQPTANPKQ